jgi:hypothetical protein
VFLQLQDGGGFDAVYHSGELVQLGLSCAGIGVEILAE